MGVRFAWATPEYILWRMTIGQVMMFLQYANEKPEPDSNGGVKSADKMTYEEAIAKRDELRKQFGDIGNG